GATLRVLGWIGHWRPLALALQTAALAAGGYFLGPQFRQYLIDYFVEYPKYSAPTYGGLPYGDRETLHFIKSQSSKYRLLMMTAVEVNQPQVFPMFYNRITPKDWDEHHTIGYLIIDPAEYQRYSGKERILAALRPNDLNLFSDYTVLRHIVAPGGQEEFVI